jgi:hypothetical protein
LDTVDVLASDELIPQPAGLRRLLAFLAPREHPVLRLVAAWTLWPETTEDRAGDNLRFALWRAHHRHPTLSANSGSNVGLTGSAVSDIREATSLARKLVDPRCEPSGAEDLTRALPAEGNQAKGHPPIPDLLGVVPSRAGVITTSTPARLLQQ